MAGRLCDSPKVSPWWEAWSEPWMREEEGYRTWDDFERAIRLRFTDVMEVKIAQRKFKRVKQTGKLCDYISFMQNTNLTAGYPPN